MPFHTCCAVYAASGFPLSVQMSSTFLPPPPLKFRPTHTLVLYTNHLPKVGATDDGIWRRLIVIPFGAKISGSGDIDLLNEQIALHGDTAQ